VDFKYSDIKIYCVSIGQRGIDRSGELDAIQVCFGSYLDGFHEVIPILFTFLLVMIIALIETIMMDYTLSCPAGQLLIYRKFVNVGVANFNL
jgi:hypothetical protein